MELLTIDSTVRAVAVTINLRDNDVSLQKAAQQIGISSKRLSAVMKMAGYTYRESLWVHSDYESHLMLFTVNDFISGNVPFTYEQTKELTRLIDSRIVVMYKQENMQLHESVKKLGYMRAVSKNLRVGQDLLNELDEFCELNHVHRSYALNLAINDLLEKYSYERRRKKETGLD